MIAVGALGKTSFTKQLGAQCRRSRFTEGQATQRNIGSMRDEPHAAFKQWLRGNGATIVPAKRDCEVLRFVHDKATGIIVANKAGAHIPDVMATRYLEQFKRSAPAPVNSLRKSKRVRKREARIEALTTRDGGRDCFYCGESIITDVSIEHLVPQSHRGPDNLSNLCLAHTHCNQNAQNLSVVQKVILREKNHCKIRQGA